MTTADGGMADASCKGLAPPPGTGSAISREEAMRRGGVTQVLPAEGGPDEGWGADPRQWGEALDRVRADKLAKAHPSLASAVQGKVGFSTKFADAFRQAAQALGIGDPDGWLADWQEWLAKRGSDLGALSKEEALALRAYTSSAYYATLNAQLRARILPDDVAGLIYLTDSALEKLPPFIGTVYRQTPFLPPDVFKSIGELKNASLALCQSYLSTSYERGAFGIPGCTTNVVNWVIETRSGRKIDLFSGSPEEKEVLLRRGTTLKITNVVNAEDGTLTVYATEVEDAAGKFDITLSFY